MPAVTAEAPGQREIYVYVIGEASRAMPVGSCTVTTARRIPGFEGIGRRDRRDFRNMLTQSNTTHKSVPMILSSVRTNEHDELFRRKGLPALFNEAGFRTWFLSNQSPQGAMIDKLARDADSLIYMGHPRYDMQLLDTMKRIVEADTENDLLFILHCYGSHFSYHQRYPREAAYFLPDDDVAIERQHKQKIWNAYDNSIRYTDAFLSSVIGYLASLDCVHLLGALLYCADHGEDMLDDDRERFLHASPTTTCLAAATSLRWRGFRTITSGMFPANRPPLPPAMKTLRRRHMRCSRPSPTLPVSRRITFTGRRRWQAPPTIRRCSAVISTTTTAPCRSGRRDSTGPTWPISAGGASNVAGFGRRARQRNRWC
ncbi:MAG: phosphoethanolamine transferase [Alistipes finegoldii]